MNMTGIKRQLICFALLLLGFNAPIDAASVTWKATATDSLWSTGGNWTGGAPANGDDVSLDVSGANDPTNQDLAALTLNSITLLPNGGLTLTTGNAFTLANGGSIVNNSNGTLTIGLSIALLGDATLNASSTGGLLFNNASIISGSGNITIQSPSSVQTITLVAVNTFTGNLLVNGGTLIVGADARLGNAANDLVFGGGTFRANGNITLGAGRVLSFSTGSGSIQVTGGNTFQLTTAGQLAGGNTMTYIGSQNVTPSTMIITAANAGLTGTVAVNANNVTDILDLQTSNALGTAAVTMTKGTLKLTNDTATTFGNNTTVNAAASGDATITIDRATAGAGINHTMGTLSVGTNPLTVNKGANVTSGTAGLIFGATTFTGNPTFTLTGANMTLGNLSTGNTSRTVTVANGSTGQLHFSGTVTPGNGNQSLVFDNAAAALAGSTTFDSGSTFVFTLGTTSDKVRFFNYSNGEVVLNSNAITINQGAGFAAGSFTLFDFFSDSGTTATAHGFTNELGAVTIAGGGFSGALVYNANTISLTVSSSANNLDLAPDATAYGGVSTITQTGTGSQTLIGTNTSTGTATVNSGTLTIGTSAGGNWAGSVVANGGILKGRGTITGNVTINSGATYSPGNSPGIQVVAGNLTINPGGSLLIEIDGATAGNGSGFHDQTQVSGTAAINGGTLQGFTIFSGSNNFVPQFGTKVTFLTASSVTGSFQSYDFSGNGNGVSWMPEYRNTEVNLFAVPADFGNVSGFNSNQNSVGRALQSFRPAAIDARTVAGSSGVTATSDVGKIFNGLMRQDNSGLKTAYDQLSPEKLTAMSATVKQFGSISNSGTNQRLSQIRWGDRGVSLNGITLQTLDGDYENELLAVEKGAILIPKKKFSGKTGFFVNTTGSYSDVDSDERRIGYENRLGGITAGIDQELTKEVTAGFFAGQGYADTKLGGGGGSVEANSGRIGIYGGYHKNGYYLNGSLGAGTTSFDTKRNIGFIGETASGSTQGYDLSGQIVGGVDFQTDEWVWGPIAKLDYGYQWIEKYNERGSAARLNLDSQAGASAETGAGMRVSRPFNYNGWKWIPELRLMGSHQWEKPNDIRAQFAAGGDAFTVHPEGAGQEMIIPGAGLQLRFSETTTLNFGYEARVNLESCSHQLDLGVMTKF